MCLKFPIACILSCGREDIPRDVMAEHVTTHCPKAEHLCPFSVHGCDFKVSLCPVLFSLALCLFHVSFLFLREINYELHDGPALAVSLVL